MNCTDGYRLVLQQGDFAATMVALAVGTHDHVESFLNGHKGYVFDQKTGQLRELRLGTATETAVEMVPSAELQAEQAVPDQPYPPLFADFTDEMLLRLGVPEKDLAAVRRLRDPNDLECMTLLQSWPRPRPRLPTPCWPSPPEIPQRGKWSSIWRQVPRN